jgi:CheY-like chemotaxis protein
MQTRILIVDDEKMIAFTLAAIVESRGYKVRSASSGEQAIKIAQEFTPDILLTDYSMPGMNGLEVAARISREFPGCRIFLLTAYVDSTKFRREPRQAQITVLNKPISPAELLRAIADPECVPAATCPRVLNVDDVAAHRYSITRLLLRRGFVVEEAGTGAEALMHIKTGEFDAVLLDVNLPDFNGFEVCRRIREQLKSKVPIVHFTATYHEPNGAAQSKSVGADAYVEQPVEPDQLVGRLREIIQQSIARA